MGAAAARASRPNARVPEFGHLLECRCCPPCPGPDLDHRSPMTATLSRAAALAGALSISLALAGAAAAQGPAGLLQLRFASFDPVLSVPEVPAGLASTSAQRLS